MKTPSLQSAVGGILLAAGLVSAPAAQAGFGLSIGYYGGHGHGGHGHGYGYGHRYGGHHGYYGYSRPYAYGHSYYRPYRYGYSYSRPYYPSYRYYGSDDHDYPASTRRSSTEAEYDTASTVVSSAQATTGSAWEMLGAGRQAEALSRFAEEAQQQPAAPLPKLGYALAASAGGDHERAAWAMRRAFAIEPKALHYAQLSDENRELVNTLAQQYADTPPTNARDSAFMAAALNYLRRDGKGATEQLERARENGEDSVGANKLEQALAEEPNAAN